VSRRQALLCLITRLRLIFTTDSAWEYRGFLDSQQSVQRRSVDLERRPKLCIDMANITNE